jgi:hypothetical protein
MSRRTNPTMPSASFGLLLVEGGDELAVCQVLAGSAWHGLCGWKADGRDLPNLARLAMLETNFGNARSIGIVLDAEHSLVSAQALVNDTLQVLGVTTPFNHGTLIGLPRVGAFVSPDGVGPGAIETLCREAVQDPKLAACVDQLVGCAGNPHSAHGNPRAAEDKGWLKAYIGMLSDPNLRFHQAFTHPQGIDASHPVFAPLRAFLLAL